MIAVLIHISLGLFRRRLAIAFGSQIAAIYVFVAAGKTNFAVFRTSGQQPTVAFTSVLGKEAAAFGANALRPDDALGRLGLWAASVGTAVNFDHFGNPTSETRHSRENCRESVGFALSVAERYDSNVRPFAVVVTD